MTNQFSRHCFRRGEFTYLGRNAGQFLPATPWTTLLILLALAAQFDSFRDPFVVLAGSVQLVIFGALIFSCLKFAGLPGMRFALIEDGPQP